MYVYKLEDWNKNRVKIYFEEDRPAFVLYKKELDKFGIKEGSEIRDETYNVILNDLLKKRAVSRTLYLLDSCARTEEGIRKKLESGFYPKEAIDAAVSYAKAKHYIDDAWYASAFASERISTKSRYMIKHELINRGISKEIAENAVEGLEDAEKETISRLMDKKCQNGGNPDGRQMQKLVRSLLQKGFRYEDIRDVIRSRDNFYL